MFTRLLTGLDNSARADMAYEQAVVLARRFGATLVAAHVAGDGAEPDDALLERAAERAHFAGLAAETLGVAGDPDVELATLARGVDAVLVGRRGGNTQGDALGPTVRALLRLAERPVIVCGHAPSEMKRVALAYDGGETSKRALELAARFAGVVESDVILIHAYADRDAAHRVIGPAEAHLSMQGVAYVTRLEAGEPGAIVAAVVRDTGADALFAGAHVPAGGARPSAAGSHTEEILRHTDLPVVIQP